MKEWMMSKSVEKVIEVNAPIQLCFDLWMDFERFPYFMKNIKSVHRVGNTHVWRWVAGGPLGRVVDWDAKIEMLEPNKVICWRSMPGSEVATTGTVNFQSEPDDRTRIYVDLSYEPPAGGLGEFVAELFQDPDVMVADDLKRFKMFAEEKAGTLTLPAEVVAGSY